MPQPRQIYVGSLSRRERSWHRGKRRAVARLARPGTVALFVAAVAVLSLLRV